jgi:hypothetical protein
MQREGGGGGDSLEDGSPKSEAKGDSP